jgi:hypothetical protein
MARRVSVSCIADASFPQRHHHPAAIRPKNRRHSLNWASSRAMAWAIHPSRERVLRYWEVVTSQRSSNPSCSSPNCARASLKFVDHVTKASEPAPESDSC